MEVIEMTRLRKLKERQLKRLAAVQNIDSPFSDEECLRILKNAGYGYLFDEAKGEYIINDKYERIGNINYGYFGFYSYQALTKEEKETISFPIIFYSEIYSFHEKGTGKFETFLISWPHDINGQKLSKNIAVTPDKLVRRDPVVERFTDTGGYVKGLFQNGNQGTINSYAATGTYNSFDEAFYTAKNNL